MKTRNYVFPLLAILIIVCLLAIPSTGGGWLTLPGVAAQFYSPQEMVVPAGRAPVSPSLWVSPAVPLELRQAARSWRIPIVDTPVSDSARLDLGTVERPGAVWVYALVAPFPTLPDGVTFNELLSSWQGKKVGPFAGRPLLMDESTLAAFTMLWGSPAAGSVQSITADQLVDAAWGRRPSWAIVPFEALDPRWKVLTVDGQSPVRKDFELNRYHRMQASFDYPLAVTFALTCAMPCSTAALPDLPSTNRDPAKMTTLVMTGVTALVRATAFTMNAKGITYPGRDIRDWLVDADIAHISNEVPFAANCPPPDPSQTKRLVFCSDPRYIDLLKSLGTDVVELTGNHYADYGPEATLLTLKLYRENDMSHYGGGADLEDARRPLLLENNGNKIAFIGCNSVDIGRMPTATETRPGAAPCDYDYMTRQIRELHDEGYLVIASFQYYETYDQRPFDAQLRDFRMMSDAGAVIVQGSQSHVPQTFEFDGAGFIHYGLGNLFFDQMGDAGVATRHEFIDRHIFYDGRYIGTELLTAQLEDYARPQPMSPEQRADFLSEYFAASGW